MKQQQPPALLGSISLVDSQFASRLTSKYGWLVGRSVHRAGFIYLTPSGRRASAGSGRDLHIRVQRNYASYYLKLLQTFQLEAPTTVPRATGDREQRRALQAKAEAVPDRPATAGRVTTQLETQAGKRALLELESLKRTVRKLTAATARLEPLKRASRRNEDRLAPTKAAPAPTSAAAPDRHASLAGPDRRASAAEVASARSVTASGSLTSPPEGQRQDRASRPSERLVHLVERTIRVQDEQIARMQTWKKRLADAGRANAPYSQPSSAQASVGQRNPGRGGQAADSSASGRLSTGEEFVRRGRLLPGRTASDRQARSDDAAGEDGLPLPRSARSVVDVRRRGSQSTSAIAGQSGHSARAASELEDAEQRKRSTTESGTAGQSGRSARPASELEDAERRKRPTTESGIAGQNGHSGRLAPDGSEDRSGRSAIAFGPVGQSGRSAHPASKGDGARQPSLLTPGTITSGAEVIRRTGVQPYGRMSALVHRRDLRLSAWPRRKAGLADSRFDRGDGAPSHALQARRASLPVSNAAQAGRQGEEPSASEHRAGDILGKLGEAAPSQLTERSIASANIRVAGRLPASHARSAGLADSIRSRLQASPLTASIRITSLPLRTRLAADLDSAKKSTSIAASKRGASDGSRRQLAMLIYTARGKQSASGAKSGERLDPSNNNLASGRTSKHSEPHSQGTAGKSATPSGRQSALGGIWLSSGVNSRNDARSSGLTSAGGVQQAGTTGPRSTTSSIGVSNAEDDTRRTGTRGSYNSDSSPGGTGAGSDGALLENNVDGIARPAADRRRTAEALPATDSASRNASSNEDEQSVRSRSNAPQAQLSTELANVKGMLVSGSARIRDWRIRTAAGDASGPRLIGGPLSHVHAKHAVGRNVLLRRLQAGGLQGGTENSRSAGSQTDRGPLPSNRASLGESATHVYIAARGALRITHRRSVSTPTGTGRSAGTAATTNSGESLAERLPAESALHSASASAGGARPANVRSMGAVASAGSSIHPQPRVPGRRAATVSLTIGSTHIATVVGQQEARPQTAGSHRLRLSMSGDSRSGRELLSLPHADRYRLMTTVESIGRLPFDELSAPGDSRLGAPLLLRASLAERLIHKLDRIASASRASSASSAAPFASGGAGASAGRASARPSSRVVARTGRATADGADTTSGPDSGSLSADAGRAAGASGAVQAGKATSAAALSTSATARAETTATRAPAALIARSASVTGDRRASRLAASLALVAARLARWQAPRTIAVTRSTRADANSVSTPPGAAGQPGVPAQTRRPVLPVTVHLAGRRSASSLAATSASASAVSLPDLEDASALSSSTHVQTPTTAEVLRQPQTPPRAALQLLRRSSLLPPGQTAAALTGARRRPAALLSGRAAATLTTAHRRPGQPSGRSTVAASTAARLRIGTIALTPRLLSSARLTSLTAAAMTQAAAGIEPEAVNDVQLAPLHVGPPPPSGRASGPPRLTAGRPMTRAAQSPSLQHKTAPSERPGSAIDAGSIARQPRPAPRPVPMELAMRSRVGAGAQQAQERAIHKSLTRLESELKELRTQPSAAALDVRAVTDQMYREITRRMRFEQQRRGL
ncbi:hypothetical protein [Paenibacillus sp. 598K]|uniref:hypothetical protein n=1 Tax=Paenibacillus sp. 598K TaxID=1117987 RepID=UPI000FFF5DEE|nr:hypothetical protein [Paenibacillus sp. 598K]